uniref:Variant surface glycoprotein 1125.370 n=1 Tax=Trypanosoma brucei TaxID=5691 RepID=A0A1J0R5U5_9TRYP|nr:variant surface glycoprotein 1125.370 [Trypanosoma brucei]
MQKLFVVASMLFSVTNTEAAQDDNAAAFAALCMAYGLKDAADADTIKPPLPSKESLLEPIQNLNISTATDSYFNKKDEDFAAETGQSKTDKIAAWLKANQEITAKAGSKPGSKPYARAPPTHDRNVANDKISFFLVQAVSAGETYETQKKAAEAAVAKAKAEILEAVYGKGKNSFDPSGFDTTKTNNCGQGTTGGAGVGKSIANDLLCLCTTSAAGSNQVCGGTAVSTNLASGRPQNTHLTEVTNNCKKDKFRPKLTPELIQAAIHTVMAQIGANPGTQSDGHQMYVLGKATGSGCTGADNEQCVNYKGQLTGSGNGVPWMTKMFEAAETLQAGSSAISEARTLQRHIENLAAAARAAYFEAMNPRPATPATTTGTRPTTADDKTDCSTQQTNTTCKPPCKWEAKGNSGTCKLDETQVTKQAKEVGTKEDAKKDEKCKGKEEKECKSPDCKWENNACKDFSSILNKKILLITAVFVSLIEFWH